MKRADTFMVTVVMPEGKPGGPVLFGTDGQQGMTGIEIVGDADLGTVQFPRQSRRGPDRAGR